MEGRVCGYCGQCVDGVEMLHHAMRCEDMHGSAKEILPDAMMGNVFDYIAMPCGSYIKRWTFTEHMSECFECAEAFTREMYGDHSSNRETM